MCIQLLLVSVLLLAFVSPFSSSREFSGFTPQVALEISRQLIKQLTHSSTLKLYKRHFDMGV